VLSGTNATSLYQCSTITYELVGEECSVCSHYTEVGTSPVHFFQMNDSKFGKSIIPRVRGLGEFLLELGSLFKQVEADYMLRAGIN